MTRRIVFAGGGTGGHLYPAIAIAEELRGRAPDLLFLCSDRAIDARILSAEGVTYRALPAKPAILRPRGVIRFLAGWGPSLRLSRAILREKPSVVVALGGFVAAPVVRAARLEGAPVVMVNLDAVPGRANRLIARRADRILSAAPGVGDGWKRIPPIVRRRARADRSPAECRRELGMDPGRRTLLVTGGSQGARSINALMVVVARRHAEALQGWQVLHQSGRGEEEEVREAYTRVGVVHVVRDLIDRMDLAWGAADLALGRAGAGTVAEAWANRVPTIFMPYPYHKDQHQRANAEPMREATAGGEPAAQVVTDAIDPVRNIEVAGRLLLDLLADEARRGRMRASLEALGPADGARQAAEAALEFALGKARGIG